MGYENLIIDLQLVLTLRITCLKWLGVLEILSREAAISSHEFLLGQLLSEIRIVLILWVRPTSNLCRVVRVASLHLKLADFNGGVESDR